MGDCNEKKSVNFNILFDEGELDTKASPDFQVWREKGKAKVGLSKKKEFHFHHDIFFTP